MLEFKVIENLKPNKDLTGILKNFKYKVKLGQIKTILHTNLQVIIPTEYKINKISDIFIYKTIQSITWLSSKILFIYYFLWINTSI